MNTLSNGGYLITHRNMQGLCLNNDEREEAMNSYFANTANGDAVQSPVSFESGKEALSRVRLL